MDTLETIQIDPQRVWHILPDLAEWQVRTDTGRQKQYLTGKPSVLDVASKFNWKVGNKHVRQVGQGELPDPGQKVKLGGWIVMNATDYNGIVPQDALSRMQILLDEGVEVKGVLIADDLRKLTPKQMRQKALHSVERLRAADWRKVRTDTARRISTFGVKGSKLITPIFIGIRQIARPIQQVTLHSIGRVKTIDWQRARTKSLQGVSALSLACTKIVDPISIGIRKKAAEIDWDKVKNVSGSFLMFTVIVAAAIAVVVTILPRFALVTVPIGLLAYDPWLIVVDSENRWWVVAEWFD